MLAQEEGNAVGNNNTTSLNYERRVDENYVGIQLSTEDIGEKEITNSDLNTRAFQVKDEVIPSANTLSSTVRHRSSQSIAASILNYSDIGAHHRLSCCS